MDREQARAIEWECQKVVRRYYAHVDAYEYDQAVQMFTPDVDWSVIGVKQNVGRRSSTAWKADSPPAPSDT